MKKTVAQFNRQCPALNLIQGDFVGIQEGLVEMLPDPGCKCDIIYAEIQLKVEAQAACIPIGRTDQSPDIIDQQELGVHEGGGLIVQGRLFFEGSTMRTSAPRRAEVIRAETMGRSGVK